MKNNIPEVEELKFPAIIVEHTGSGFEEQFMGQKVTLGSTSGTGETYGASYAIHLIAEKESQIQVASGSFSASNAYYKQRRLLNWMMLNVANSVMDIDFDTYEEEKGKQKPKETCTSNTGKFARQKHTVGFPLQKDI